MTILIKRFCKNLGYGVKMYYLKEPTDDYSGIAISTGDEEEVDKIVTARNAHTDLITALNTLLDNYGHISYPSQEEKDQDEDVKFARMTLAKAGAA